MHRISNSKVKWAHPLKTWLTSSSVTGMSKSMIPVRWKSLYRHTSFIRYGNQIFA